MLVLNKIELWHDYHNMQVALRKRTFKYQGAKDWLMFTLTLQQEKKGLKSAQKHSKRAIHITV